MGRLLKTDFYKIAKNKSLWVCLLVVVAMAVAMVSMQDFTYKHYQDFAVEGMGQMQMEEPTVISQIKNGMATETSIFAAIVISVLIGLEFGAGTIKNTASRGFSRSKIYLSKLTVSAIATAGLFLAGTISYFLASCCLWRFGVVPDGFWPEIARAFGLALLLNIAYSSLFTFFSFLLRQSGGAIAINICILTFAATFVQLGEMLMQNFFKWEVHFSNYLISTNLNVVSSGAALSGDDITRAVLVAVAFLVVTTGLGLWIFQKRDIK